VLIVDARGAVAADEAPLVVAGLVPSLEAIAARPVAPADNR
jgi:hypothetical protein